MRQYWALWLDHWARAAHHPNRASWQAQDYRSWRELIAALVAEGVARSEFRMVDQDAMATEVVALIDGLALQTFAELDGNVHPHQQEGTERGHNPRVPGLRLGCWSCSRLRSNYRDTT